MSGCLWSARAESNPTQLKLMQNVIVLASTASLLSRRSRCGSDDASLEAAIAGSGRRENLSGLITIRDSQWPNVPAKRRRPISNWRSADKTIPKGCFTGSACFFLRSLAAFDAPLVWNSQRKEIAHVETTTLSRICWLLQDLRIALKNLPLGNFGRRHPRSCLAGTNDSLRRFPDSLRTSRLGSGRICVENGGFRFQPGRNP